MNQGGFAHLGTDWKLGLSGMLSGEVTKGQGQSQGSAAAQVRLA